MNTAMIDSRQELRAPSRPRDPAASARDVDLMLSLLRATLVGLSMQRPLVPPSRTGRS